MWSWFRGLNPWMQIALGFLSLIILGAVLDVVTSPSGTASQKQAVKEVTVTPPAKEVTIRTPAQKGDLSVEAEDKLKKENGDLQGQVADLQGELSDLQDENSQLADKVASLQNQVDNLKSSQASKPAPAPAPAPAASQPAGTKHVRVVVSANVPVDVMISDDNFDFVKQEEVGPGQKTFEGDIASDSGLMASAMSANMRGDAYVAVYFDGKLIAEDEDSQTGYAQVLI